MRALEANRGGSVGAEPDPERSELKKVVNPSGKRRAVKTSVEEGIGNAAVACRALELARSSYYRTNRESEEKRLIRKEAVELSHEHPRYGYRRITALLKRGGFVVNAKRVARVRREKRFMLSKKQRRTKRLVSCHIQRFGYNRVRRCK